MDNDMRTAGTLKLPEKDADRYKAALQYYDIERSSAFLRRCAYALIKHAEAGDKLSARISFTHVTPSLKEQLLQFSPDELEELANEWHERRNFWKS